VAGETADDAVAVGQRLAERRIRATFDLLGEDVHAEPAARAAAAANQELLRRLPPGIDRNISIKLTMMGLEVGRDLALALTRDILQTAREVGGFVRIDMEGSRHTQAILDVFREVRREFENVGVVLQAALRRTAADVEDAIARGDYVRLCKGAYQEPAEVAFTDVQAVRESFQRLAHRLLESGRHPAIATHDEALIQDVIGFAKARGVAPSRFELQMLYGLRRSRWDELVRAGYDVRVYVPYGTHWLPYFYRRLRERKENVFFVLRHLFD
jgi:proline dehydrogenase